MKKYDIGIAMDTGSTTTADEAIVRGGTTKEIKIKRVRDKGGRYRKIQKDTEAMT